MNSEIYFPTPPKELFKYFSPDRIEVLKNFKIRFANPATFNDPFEVSPRFDLLAEQLANEAMKELAVLNARLGISASESSKFFDNYKREWLPKRIQWQNADFQRECGEKFRMLCFCESIENPLMWGHYCDSQKGFALKFDT